MAPAVRGIRRRLGSKVVRAFVRYGGSVDRALRRNAGTRSDRSHRGERWSAPDHGPQKWESAAAVRIYPQRRSTPTFALRPGCRNIALQTGCRDAAFLLHAP